MRLYSGTTEQFVEDTTQNQIAEKMRNTFFQYFRYYPSQSEVSSWRNSLRSTSLILMSANLMDHGVILEYQLPLTSKRLDCMLCGKNDAMHEGAVIIELKQWESCHPSDGDNEVMTFLGGTEREVLHPSAQVGQYMTYLQDTHTAFYDSASPIFLSACAYLHNYAFRNGDPLLSEKFRSLIERYPLFSENDTSQMKAFLQENLSGGEGLEVLQKVEKSRYRPSKKLMDHVGNMIKGKPEYVLLDEQLVAYDKVLSWARQGYHDGKKRVLIIKGGPGTGKSLIAINLMADLSLRGYNAQYATGSRAFTETLRKIIGSRGSVQFNYFNSYMNAESNTIDVLIADESHRIRKNSYNRFTPKRDRRDIPQVEELIWASKVCVLLLDDDQIVRPGEIGSSDYIREHALRQGCEIFELELEAQFRCGGSDAFVNWINNTLGISRTANVIWEGNENFDFRIVGSPEELEAMIFRRKEEGYSSRMTAGFCWPWSKPRGDGTLEPDVQIGDYCRPWNARPEASRLANGIPKAVTWAHDDGGINQIGCVYTAQGFEFDYVGVIFGDDLRYDFETQRWEGHKECSYDSVVKKSGKRFTDLVKNTYRVLLTRGLAGCYVHFMDKDTETFFKSRMEVRSE